LFSSRIKTSRLAQYCRRVGTSLEAGLEVRRVMEREEQRAAWRERSSMEIVRRSVAGGSTMTDAFAATDGFFPQLVHGMVRVGEEGGKLDQAFLRMAEHYERQISLRRTFLLGILWPMIQLVAALAIIGLLIWIMGALGDSVRDVNGDPVDFLGIGLKGNSGLLIYVTILLGLAIFGVLLYRATTAGVAAFRPLQRFFMRVPVLGSSIRTLALARMAWTLSVTTNTSMDAIASITLAIRNAQNVVYSATIEPIAKVIRQGRPVAEALRSTGEYPDDFVDAIEVGEDTGQLSESMERLSRQYEDKAKAALAALAVVAGFAVWGLVALFIIVLIIRIAMWYVGQINSLIDGI
jgi:type II secretory pathway component PulF